MTNSVLLDAGVVTRCRRRVHLEHDPTMRDTVTAPPDPTAEQRKADATAHRRSIADEIAGLVGAGLDGDPARRRPPRRRARAA